jgi:hypothetical protein
LEAESTSVGSTCRITRLNSIRKRTKNTTR